MSLRELDPSAPVGGAAPEPPAVLVAEATAARARSRRRRMREQIGLAACGVWLAAVVICALGAKWLPGVRHPSEIDPFNRLKGPTSSHLFGTDELGRDIFARVIYGARVSIVVAVVSFAIGLGIGGCLGLVAG